MSDKLSRRIALASATGLLVFSFQSSLAQAPKPGTIGNIFERILDNRGGPLAGGLASSPGQYQYAQKIACELVGANCSDAQRMGCDSVQSSVISGVVECWNGQNFRLYDYATKSEIINTSFTNVANLANNDTGRTLILAKSSNKHGYSLLNEQGKVIADSEAFGCDTFEAAGENSVACIRGSKKLVISLDDLDKAQNASLNVASFADDISLNICNIAIETLEAGKKGLLYNKNSDSYFSEMKNFKIGKETVSLYKKTSEMGTRCVMEPEGKECSAIYVTNQGLECYNYGALSFKRAMNITKKEKIDAVLTYAFKGREVVSMQELIRSSKFMPSIRIDRPDLLMQEKMYVSSGSGSNSYKGVN